MSTNDRKMRTGNFLNESVRGCVAIALSLMLIPAQGLFAQDPQGNYPPPQQGNYPPPPPSNYAPLGAEQLNQLVAPIALYPDSLVAQILTAATYPQQIVDANNWSNQMGAMPPEQRAAAADQMQWDPSVKALTAFPSVLSNMARNNNWAGALGNAYYNQPGDVMNAVQAMRIRAQAAGALRTDNHYRVMDNGGLVVIEPYNPALVYVPYYNPWTIYGGPIVPWGGYYWGGPPRGVVLAGFGLGFGAGISLGLFTHYGWGYNNWSPNWHGGVVVYNHTTYISRSTTVINRGYFGGNNRGVYEHAGPGVPHNFRPAVTAQSAAFRPGQARPGSYSGSNYANRPVGSTPQTGRQFGQPGQPVRPGVTPNNGAPRQFGNQTPASRPGGTQGTYSRPAGPQTGGTYNRPAGPQTGGGNYNRPAAPQVARPQASVNNAPAYHPQPNTARPQASAPVHQTQSAPVRQSSGGGSSHSSAPSHSAPSHSNGKR